MCPICSLFSSYQYQDENSTLARSLFPSDQSIISQAAIDTILNSKIQLHNNSKVALINFPQDNVSSTYGYGYWRSESYLKMQQSYIDSLSFQLLESEFVESVIHLPSMLTPQTPTLPVLREAAVRLQSPILIIFRINSDIYEEYRLFRSPTAKAYSTIELVLLDVRTGIIPFTTIATEEYLTSKSKSDSNNNEMMRRAENVATLNSLKKAISELESFFLTQE